MSDFEENAYEEGFDDTQDYLDYMCNKARDYQDLETESDFEFNSDEDFFNFYNHIKPSSFIPHCKSFDYNCPLYSKSKKFDECINYYSNHLGCRFLDLNLSDEYIFKQFNPYNEFQLKIEPNSLKIIPSNNNKKIIYAYDSNYLILIKNISFYDLFLNVYICNYKNFVNNRINFEPDIINIKANESYIIEKNNCFKLKKDEVIIIENVNKIRNAIAIIYSKKINCYSYEIESDYWNYKERKQESLKNESEELNDDYVYKENKKFDSDAEEFLNYIKNGSKDKFDFSSYNLRCICFKNANLEGFNLSKVDFDYSSLEGANLKSAILTKTSLEYTDLINSDLSNANLSNSHLRYANLLKAKLIKTNLTNADLSYAILKNANLSNVFMSGVKLIKTDLTNTDFSNADLLGADFSNAILKNTKFLSKSNLRNTHFYHSFLNKVNFENANLTNANFYFAKLNNVNFENANLTDVDFGFAIIKNTNFKNANLTNAKIKYAKFINCNIIDAKYN